MPHTSRKKKPVRVKRQEYTDDDGWTRISSSPRTKSNKTYELTSESNLDLKEPNTEWPIADIPQVLSDITLDTVRAKYDLLKQRWLKSESSRILNDTLTSQALQPDNKVTECILLGSGSYSGARDGWIERHDVALLQTVVFESMVDVVERVQSSRPKCYAQEPYYNDLDTEFLASIQIVKVNDPEAFGFMTNASLVYLPGAELAVHIRTLFHEPMITLSHPTSGFWRDEEGNARTDRIVRYAPRNWNDGQAERRKLDQTEWSSDEQAGVENYCKITENYVERHQSKKIPDFDMANHPFHGQYLYWPSDVETDMVSTS